MSDKATAELAINTIRTLSIDAIENANSGHPGLPLGAAPMAYALWQRHLRHNPRNPQWPDRDRFVLSAGHGSMLLYSLLHLTGYPLTLDDLRSFRQWESATPGHPERDRVRGVEATTGPLGQGSANAVGMAMAERSLAHRFNRPGHTIVDHYTFALVSDGDLMEGVAAEAGSLAGHLGLGKLIYLYDANDVTLDGPTSLTFSQEDVCRRYEAYGWHVLRVEDGNTDVDAIDRAIAAAKAETGRPSLIWIHTTIGYGSPNKGGTAACHGSPLGDSEIALVKKTLGWTESEPLSVPSAVREHMGAAVGRGEELEADWQQRFEAWSSAEPDLRAEWDLCMSGRLPDGWDSDLPTWNTGDKVATRAAAGVVENAIAARVPWLIGGDADLSCSTKSGLKDGGSFDGRSGAGRNVHFGVREHAMGAICNGMDYHGGVRPFASTFFVFSDYMRPAVRVASLNEQPIIYIWTHDSIGVGEDGPTHQPVEHLMSLRAMPNLYVVRPADAIETAEAWRLAMRRTDGPTALVLSRQGLPVFERQQGGGVERGAYIVADSPLDLLDVLLLATGSEVSIALGARELLRKRGVGARVVSMPCWEAFAAQPADYRASVLPRDVRARVSVEAGVTLGWERWIGDRGVAIGVDRFGASAPGPMLMERYGLTETRVADAAAELVG